MRAEIYIEDCEELSAGANVRFVFVDGFNKASNAHQMANIIRKILDDMATRGELTALTDREDIGEMAEANAELAALQAVTTDAELAAQQVCGVSAATCKD